MDKNSHLQTCKYLTKKSTAAQQVNGIGQLSLGCLAARQHNRVTSLSVPQELQTEWAQNKQRMPYKFRGSPADRKDCTGYQLDYRAN